jgi:hypothetical protein
LVAGLTHTYRKGFEHQFEAEGTANGFATVGNIDKPGPTKAWVEEDAGTFYAYVELEGGMDPDEVLAATGYERVN